MISESDIVNGYMWILGRFPSQDDIAAYRARFRDNNDENTVRTFQHDLLASEEFRNRRLLMHRMRHIGRAGLDQDRLVFVHIEKSGGTTLHEMLCSQFPPERICPERTDTLGDWSINELAAYGLFSGHFDLECCRSIPGRVRMLTMLREPKARLLSLYRFWKAHVPHPERDFYDLVVLARECPVEAFFSHPRVIAHPSLRDGVTGQLTRTEGAWELGPGHALIDDPAGMLEKAWEALLSMAGFGILERYEQSRSLLNRQLGLDMQPVPPRQVLSEMVRVSEEMVERPPEPMTPRLDALLDAMTPIDRPLYARALALFEQRVAALETPAAPVAPAVLPRPRAWLRPLSGRLRPLSGRLRPLAGRPHQAVASD